MKSIIHIFPMIMVLFLVSCKTGQKVQKGTDNGSENQPTRLSSFKQSQFDKSFFDGISEKMLGNYDNALHYFEQAVKIDPNSAAAYNEIANASVQLGRIADAEKAAEKAVSLDKGENKWYLLQLADIYRFEKKWSQAAAQYERVIKIDPDDVENYFRLGAVYEVMNKIPEALKVYDKIEGTFGVSEEVVLQKHHLYIESGKYDKAISEINKLIAANPDNIKYDQILAETYMKAGNETKAMEVYDRITQKNPDNGETELVLADYYLKKGDKELARKNFEEALKINPDYKPAQEALQQLK